LQVDFSEVSMHELIDSGTYSNVYRADYHGQEVRVEFILSDYSNYPLCSR